MKKLILAIAILAGTTHTQAQDNKDKVRIEINGGQVNVYKGDKEIVGKEKKKKSTKRVSSTLGFDLGFVNCINSSTASFNSVQSNLANTPALQGQAGKGSSLELSTAKSINVNIYPFYYSIHLDKHRVANIITGLGLNINNFRYVNDIGFINNQTLAPQPTIEYFSNYNGSTPKKTKIATNYLTVPLMLQLKPRIGDKTRLVFGAGASAGYLLRGWTKVKDDDGKRKSNISREFNTWQVNLIGEVGIDDKIRFYGSYALQGMYKNLNKELQVPFTVGIRFFGL
jgi:hypothetical protein